MNIGEVIRKNRKSNGLTQEEMARFLGVTPPAVNKWESGSTMPDIMLLAPIARLLHISLEELLSFREELSEQEIRELTKEADRRFTSDGYEDTFKWAKAQIEMYPNCEFLVYGLSVMLDAHRMLDQVSDAEKYDPYLLGCYERLLKSGNETIRNVGAESLYGYYLRKNDLKKAEEYLSYFSKENPERKRKQAAIYEKAGKLADAYKAYEEIIFSGYQVMDAVLNSLYRMKLGENDLKAARYYVEKRKMLTTLLEMGEYGTYTAELDLVQSEQEEDQTIACVEGLLKSMASLCAFTHAPLYSHMTFKEIDPDFMEKMKQDVLNELHAGKGFEYMENNPRWIELLKTADHRINEENFSCPCS